MPDKIKDFIKIGSIDKNVSNKMQTFDLGDDFLVQANYFKFYKTQFF